MKIALIGCGRACEVIYIPALKKFPEVDIAAVIDPLEERTELIGNNFPGCDKSSSLSEEIINKIDAAIIITSPETHVRFASELLKKNKYVLVEKPLSDTLNGIDELKTIESSSAGHLMMGFNHRYWEPVRLLIDKLNGKGRIDSAEIIFTSNANSWMPVSLKSDPLDDLGPHVFDLARFIFQKEIVSISAEPDTGNGNRASIKLKDDILVRIMIAHSETTVKSIDVFSGGVRYYAKLSSVRLTPSPGRIRKFLDLSDMISRKLSGKTSPIKKSYEIQLSNFFESVRQNKKPEPGTDDGIMALLAAEAARASIKNSGREFYLNEFK